MARVVGGRLRLFVGLAVLAELAVFLVVAGWIGIGWTLLATLATSALGWLLLARQGTRALTELRDRARSRQAAGRELGDAGLVAVGGLLMVLPGFLGDVLGLLCLLPGTRGLVRAALTRFVIGRIPVALRPPVRVRSARTEPLGGPAAGGSTRMTPLVIEGEIVRDVPEDRPPVS
ncbi:FxsA family protein [Blastococcus sp. CT_GayMR19]|uniref:FxsA family protein n=1 Tax=Blastococcus sp. CT_GayMR19 TaxID=2559608 RepID=UPI00107423FD|nr:FxsA family protein [Blastococcus sp. CT_GayMR19]TFV77597.1 FxsA family protein [Blastococcus sp. CT_GayMR19]